MKVALASDHAGFDLKERLRARVAELGHEALDLGAYSRESVDYPEFGAACAHAVTDGRAALGVAVCGSGVGIAIAANKVAGCRAALCHDTYSAHQCVEHDDVNLLCLGAWIIGPKLAEEVLKAYLNASFSTDEDFRRRVRKLGEMEKR